MIYIFCKVNVYLQCSPVLVPHMTGGFVPLVDVTEKLSVLPRK